ncbi:uncharacterized protein N7483_003731 [Penicillium malachiteum]|uniref:uncharacterized protein n=1 Tax=Penicillium malachiteum TaxID=1324776 RepID=UPI002546B976|nr:uncharacterized protein N7483_003731 [Penicillium malachiteum]KAJ5729223.1 hypothetical protein N7483_003731 [Penicillium malachiteum]
MRAILFSLSASVFYMIWYFSHASGLHDLAQKAVASGKLPGLDEALRTVYTGVEPIDKLLTLLTVFFYPAMDGQDSTLLLHSIGFSGTFAAAWTLIVLESWRKGNSGTVAAYAGPYFAFATPLLCALQLGCSVTVRRPHADNIRVPRAVLAVIPTVFVIGFLVPSNLMVLPAPEIISVDWKQIAISAWHPWPAYVSILTTVSYYVIGPLFSNNHRASMSSLRWVYASAFIHTAVSHLATLTLSLTTVLAPALLEDKYIDALHPSKVYSFPVPWSGLKVNTVPEGVHVFLRWDYMIGSAGILLWALKLHIVAQRQVVGGVSWASLLFKIGVLSLFSGPAGAAVELMWERDELIFRETGSSRQVTTAKKSS